MTDNTNENMADENEEIQIDDLQSSQAGVGSVAEAEDLPDMSDFGVTSGKRKDEKDVQAIYDIPVQISAVLGKASMQVSQLLKLGSGAVVELDRKVGEAVDIYVNDRLVARGEVTIVEDRLGIIMTEIIKTYRQ